MCCSHFQLKKALAFRVSRSVQDVFITQMNILLGPSLNCHSSVLCLFIVVLILIIFPSLVFFVSGFDYVLSRLIKVYFRLFSISLSIMSLVFCLYVMDLLLCPCLTLCFVSLTFSHVPVFVFHPCLLSLSCVPVFAYPRPSVKFVKLPVLFC